MTRNSDFKDATPEALARALMRAPTAGTPQSGQPRMASSSGVGTHPEEKPTRLPRQEEGELFADYFERLKSFVLASEEVQPENPYLLDDRELVEWMSQWPTENIEQVLRGSFDRSREAPDRNAGNLLPNQPINRESS